MTTLFYLNGQFVEKQNAHLPCQDLGVLRGFSIFDALRTYQGRPFHLEDHLLRFASSAAQVGLPLPHSLSTLASLVEETLSLNALPEALITLLLTAGVSSHTYFPTASPNFAILIAPLVPTHSPQGVTAITLPLTRSLPAVKTTHYLPAIVALEKSLKTTPHEVLYLSPQHHILEGSRTNFFALKGKTLITCCSDQVLPGITRDVLLRLLEPHYQIEKRSLAYEELPEIDEAFLTSTTQEILPLTLIDSIPIPQGPHAQTILKHFRTYTQNPAEWLPCNSVWTPNASF